MISVLFITLLFHSNCMQYIPYETKTKLPSEQGYFYIKASDYSNPNYIYILLTETNIMLDSLEYCSSDNVPKDDYNYTLKVISPYKSIKNDNVIQDLYKFAKNQIKGSFIIFFYKGEKKSEFAIEVECSDDDSLSIVGLERWVIALIVIAGVVGLGIAIVIIVFAIKMIRKKKVIVGQIVPNSNQQSVIEPDYNTAFINKY